MSNYIVTFIPARLALVDATPSTEVLAVPQWAPGQRPTEEIVHERASSLLGEPARILEIRSPDAGAGLTHAPHAGYSGLDTRSNW